MTSYSQRFGVSYRTFVAPTYLEMVRFAAEFLQSDLAGDADVTLSPGADHAERLWRSAAGAVHGTRWPEWEFQSVVNEPDREYVIPDVKKMTEVFNWQRASSQWALCCWPSPGKEALFPALWSEGQLTSPRIWLLATTLHPSAVDEERRGLEAVGAAT